MDQQWFVKHICSSGEPVALLVLHDAILFQFKNQIFIQSKKIEDTSGPFSIDLYIAIVYSSLYADDILMCVWYRSAFFSMGKTEALMYVLPVQRNSKNWP